MLKSYSSITIILLFISGLCTSQKMVHEPSDALEIQRALNGNVEHLEIKKYTITSDEGLEAAKMFGVTLDSKPLEETIEIKLNKEGFIDTILHYKNKNYAKPQSSNEPNLYLSQIFHYNTGKLDSVFTTFENIKEHQQKCYFHYRGDSLTYSIRKDGLTRIYRYRNENDTLVKEFLINDSVTTPDTLGSLAYKIYSHDKNKTRYVDHYSACKLVRKGAMKILENGHTEFLTTNSDRDTIDLKIFNEHKDVLLWKKFRNGKTIISDTYEYTYDKHFNWTKKIIINWDGIRKKEVIRIIKYSDN